MIRCEHAVPGRLRLKAWPASQELLNGLRQSLLSVPGVRSVEARLMTGSLVIHHDETISQGQILLHAGIQSHPLSPLHVDAISSHLGAALVEMAMQTAIEHLLGRPAVLLLNALL